MKKNIFSLFFVWIFLSLSQSLLAQTTKHPRVLDLEKTLSREALEVLKGRFPDKPFLVNVRIDPMMRERKEAGVKNKERLPYFEISEEEIIDEWDDPSFSLMSLVNRVKKIHVNMSVPNQLSDDEIAELKSSVIYSLGLLEARDTVEVNKRSWNNQGDNNKNFRWDWFGFGTTSLVIILTGLFLIIWSSVKKLTAAIQESGSNGKGGGMVSAPVAASSSSPSQESSKGNLFGSADLRLQDPIKNREIIAGGLKILLSHSHFPSLEDMIVFQKAAEENPSDLGALLGEFPIEMRKTLFSYSYGDKWMEAMIDPSDVSSVSIEILNKCIKNPRNEFNKEWQLLLICVWRLSAKKKDFFTGLSSADAFNILGFLPKSFAIEAAREVFPGAWGQLLDPSFSAKRLPAEKISEFTEKAIKILPFRDLSVIETYKNEKELLIFLKNSDPIAEKEIYLAAGDSSLLWSIRPPFYRIFELSAPEYEKIVPLHRIEEWALVMFNVGRPERREVEKRMTDKQKFRYFELLKSYDMKAPSKVRIGELRELIGKSIHTIHAQYEAEQALLNFSLDDDKEGSKAA